MKRRQPQFYDRAATELAGFIDPRSYCRRGKEFRFGKDMELLRNEAFARSRGFCEMRVGGVLGGFCQRPVTREYCELHHEPPLSQGGDDSIDGVLISCQRCHQVRHNRMIKSDRAERREHAKS
jgi:5-methylcytosine-specific restriction endonuclease McrA